jgi:hypothetical protein
LLRDSRPFDCELEFPNQKRSIERLRLAASKQVYITNAVILGVISCLEDMYVLDFGYSEVDIHSRKFGLSPTAGECETDQ